MSVKMTRVCLNVALNIIKMAASSTLSTFNNRGSHHAIWGS